MFLCYLYDNVDSAVAKVATTEEEDGRRKILQELRKTTSMKGKP